MKMEGPGNLTPREPSFEQKHNEFRKVVERQIQEYALGLDPALTVEVTPLDIDYPDGLRFIFRYNGEEKGFIDHEIGEGTLPMAEKTLEEFYLTTKKFKN